MINFLNDVPTGDASLIDQYESGLRSLANHEGPNSHSPELGGYEFPSWLIALLKEELGWDWHSPHHYLFDHRRHVGPVAVIEPYGVGMDDFDFLVRFCRKHDLNFSVSGHSAWMPGQTIRVVIWRRRDEQKAQGVCLHVRTAEVN